MLIINIQQIMGGSTTFLSTFPTLMFCDSAGAYRDRGTGSVSVFDGRFWAVANPITLGPGLKPVLKDIIRGSE
ncbi:hypothetical protein BJY01DRAFT_247293 [Aspergillus pseudoustus]|uniref:Uncharacterized protein n=1 Tax=Aspergillus pseudoustus TaxID=1810923 RepID=A0ABR4K3S0_9EURO